MKAYVNANAKAAKRVVKIATARIANARVAIATKTKNHIILIKILYNILHKPLVSQLCLDILFD